MGTVTIEAKLTPTLLEELEKFIQEGWYADRNDAIRDAVRKLIREAVQQSKIGRKRKANRASNPKRSEIFGAKSNCGTASREKKLTKEELNILEDVEWGLHG